MSDAPHSRRAAQRAATRFTSPWTAACQALAVVALLPLSAQTAHAQGCSPRCISTSSVVHAAGVPPDFMAAASRLRFQGDTLAAGDAAVVADMARAIKALPPRAVLSLDTAADPGLNAATSSKQAKARALALQKALLGAGVAAAQIKVNAGR